MKKLLITTLMAYVALLLAPSIGEADVIKCTFTEPFISTKYSMAQTSLTYVDSLGNTRVEKNVSFQIKAAGAFDLVSSDGKVLQSLTVTNRGSDGMSELIFPYEVKDSGLGMTGGCVSNSLKATHQ